MCNYILYIRTRIHVQNLTSRRQMEEIVHDVSIRSGWALCPRGGESARIGSIRVINHNFLTVNTNNLRFARHLARIIGDTS